MEIKSYDGGGTFHLDVTRDEFISLRTGLELLTCRSCFSAEYCRDENFCPNLVKQMKEALSRYYE